MEPCIFKASDKFTGDIALTLEKYTELQELFARSPEEFWTSLALEHVHWFKNFDEVFSYSQKPFFTWFKGGQTNISYNCIDKHLPKYAGKTAIIFEGEFGDTRKLNYQELYHEVNNLAGQLKDLGINKGDKVCIYMPLCPEAIVSMHACLRIGAVHSVVFAGFSSQALRDRIEDLEAKLVITADGAIRKGAIVPLLETVQEATEGLAQILCYNRVAELKTTIKNPQYLVLINEYLEKVNKIKITFGNKLIDWTKVVSNSIVKPELMDSEDPSFVLYTSGSTGKPKGIEHTTAGYLLWAKLSTAWVFDLKDSDIYWCTADVGWITGHTYVAYGPLANAATIFIYEGAPNFPDESRFWSLIEKYKITTFYTAPTAIRTFMQWGLEPVLKHDLSSLRLLGTVGEPINPSAWIWFYGNIGKSKCPIVDTWWQTETGGIMITTLPGIQSMKAGAAGLPLPGVMAEVNQEGLLVLKHPVPSMARTIYGDDDRYARVYWKDIQSLPSKLPDARLASPRKRSLPDVNEHFEDERNDADGTWGVGSDYVTGDAASIDEDGYISIEGRVDDVINVSGHRLGTAEIESALVAHDLVVEAAVISVPHALKGEAIIAYVVSISIDYDKTQLENEFKDQVVKMIGSLARPEKVIICEGLPKTRSGKIMRRLLKDIAQGKKPSGDTSTLENKFVLDDLE